MARTIPSICTLYKLNTQASRNDRTATEMNPAVTATHCRTQQLGKDTTSAYNYTTASVVKVPLFDFNITLGFRGEGF